MIVVDTSIWIEYFRGSRSDIVEKIHMYLDEDQIVLPVLVKLEILAGCSKKNFAEVKRTFSALPLLYPEYSTWEKIEEWLPLAIGHGENFSIPDLIIAAIAQERQAFLWTQDGDYKRMEKLRFVKLLK